MKKIFALLCLAVCLLLAGCGTHGGQEGPAYHAPAALESVQGYNAQNKYLLYNHINFQETEDFFCGATTDYACYYDKASGVSGPLCADPACAHDSKGCGAYVGEYSSMICYDGKRYWIADNGRDTYLCRSDLAGTNQERLKTFDYDQFVLVYQPQWFAIHRGRLYALGRAQIVEGTEVGLRMTLLSMSLDESQKVAVLYDKTFGTGVEATARFVGDSIYLSMFNYSNGSPRSISITKFGIEDGSTETVYEEAGFTESLNAIWVTDQGEIYLPGFDSDRAYVWKLENGKRKEILCWEGLEVARASVADGIAFVTSVKDELRWIDVADMSGNAIYSGNLFPEELPEMPFDPNECHPSNFAVVGGDREKIIVNIEANSSGTAKRPNYTILLDLRNNLKPTVLWSSER